MNVSFMSWKTRKQTSEPDAMRVQCRAPELGTLRKVCCECKRQYDVTVYDARRTVLGRGDTEISHGYCETCETAMFEKAERE